MYKLKEIMIVYMVGFTGYPFVELLWRGYSHWSMAITGGTCFLSIHLINRIFEGQSLWRKCMIGSILITVFEFIAGCIINLRLNLCVWDYSDLPFNIFGQICLPYTFLWYILCIPTIKLSDFISYKLRVTKRA